MRISIRFVQLYSETVETGFRADRAIVSGFKPTLANSSRTPALFQAIAGQGGDATVANGGAGVA
jgi:hypothetical protein